MPDFCLPSMMARTKTRTPGDDEKDGDETLKGPGRRGRRHPAEP